MLALLDFSEATAECHKVIVSLETCECVTLSDNASRKQGGDGLGALTSQVSTRVLHTRNAVSTNTMLAIPLAAAPTLRTVVGSFTWSLKLQIVLGGTDRKLQDCISWSVPLAVCGWPSEADLPPSAPSRATPLLPVR